jgi:hypothetical protein
MLAKKEQEQIDARAGLIPSKAAEKANIFQLIDKLDDLDPDGKSRCIEVGTYVETKEIAFRISGIDIENEKVMLTGLKTTNEERSFSDFIEAFKKNKAKRSKQLQNFPEFIERVG